MKDVRWRQRYENFDKAVLLLCGAFENRTLESFSDLESEGLLQRFEYSFELGWKTLKDYLEFNGIVIASPVGPRSAIKAAFASGLLADGQVWIDMMLHRNKLSHMYDAVKAKEVLGTIQGRYPTGFDRSAGTSEGEVGGRTVNSGLTEAELSLIRDVFERSGNVRKVLLFGSRAKGTARPNSDVDLAVFGDMAELECGKIAAELDLLPLPYQFDVLRYDSIENEALREHIERVGITLFDSSAKKQG